jgi:alginate O-acetyltransferase complex protein AlgI
VSVLFFPHLIAGPLIHYQAIMRQFTNRFAVSSATLLVGLPIFAVGLAKKTFMADNIAPLVTPLFIKAETAPLEYFSAWAASLGYTAQLYFDFSGYSDMAVGLGLMFGIALPVNFRSPYKATSIIEFWRRWHITLSGFLRDYLYIPLGGNRVSPFRRYANMMIVMLIGGLWHGAGWTFVVWGGLHGVYLIINHLWRNNVRLPGVVITLLKPLFAVLTFLAIVAGWVFFRASSFVGAENVLLGMMGQTYSSFPGQFAYLAGTPYVWGVLCDDRGLLYSDVVKVIIFLPLAFCIIWLFRNTAEMFNLDEIGTFDGPLADFTKPWPRSRFVSTGLLAGALIWLSLFGVLGAVPSEFIYFRF